MDTFWIYFMRSGNNSLTIKRESDYRIRMVPLISKLRGESKEPVFYDTD